MKIIPQPIIKLIESKLKETIATILAKDGLREAFLILAGVIQGDTQASY